MYGKNNEVVFRKNKIDATVAFPHLSGLSKEEAKREYEKLIGLCSPYPLTKISMFHLPAFFYPFADEGDNC